MAKTKRSLREANDAKNRSRVESECSSPNKTSGSINDRSSTSEVAESSVRRSARSTKGVPSKRVQMENEESGSQTLLERVAREARSRSYSPYEKDQSEKDHSEKDPSPANSDITPKIVIETALRALDSTAIPEKRSSPESNGSTSLAEGAQKPKRTWPKQYRKLQPFDGEEHPPCNNCGGKVRPQKGGINSRNEYWWRCLNKTCRRWYGRTSQRPDFERSRRQSAAKQRRKRERAKVVSLIEGDEEEEMEQNGDKETQVFRKLRRQSRVRRGERPFPESSSDNWYPDDGDNYRPLFSHATDSSTFATDNEWLHSDPVFPPQPVERVQTYRPLSWSNNKPQLRIVNIMVPCPEQSALVKLL